MWLTGSVISATGSPDDYGQCGKARITCTVGALDYIRLTYWALVPEVTYVDTVCDHPHSFYRPCLNNRP